MRWSSSLILHHGVSKSAETAEEGPQLCCSAGMMILSAEASAVHPLSFGGTVVDALTVAGAHGVVSNVVFPTGIDRRDDPGQPERFDFYYGMADHKIGVALLVLPEFLPPEGVAEPPPAR